MWSFLQLPTKGCCQKMNVFADLYLYIAQDAPQQYSYFVWAIMLKLLPSAPTTEVRSWQA